jgi:hypothetical protein
LEFQINPAKSPNPVCETAIRRFNIRWNEAELGSLIQLDSRRAAAPTDALVRAMKEQL